MKCCDDPERPCCCYDCRMADDAHRAAREYQRQAEEAYHADAERQHRRDQALALIEGEDLDELTDDAIQKIATIVSRDIAERTKEDA